MKIDLWIEGFADIGGGQPAHLAGTYEARDFEHAIQQYCWTNHCKYQRHDDGTFCCDYGLQFFDNEADARASFR